MGLNLKLLNSYPPIINYKRGGSPPHKGEGEGVIPPQREGST